MQKTLAAFQTGDIPTLSKLFSEDVVWHVPGQNPMAKEYRGQGEVFAFFGQLMEQTGGTFKITPIDSFANDQGGIYLDRITAERPGKKLDVRLILHVVIKEGRIVAGFDYFHQEHLWDAFWK
jgi:ketosteroid isomerase-like protein